MNSNSSIGILFDIDGTLVDSFSSHWKAWRINAERYGYGFSDEMFLETFGGLNRDYLPRVLGERSTTELIAEIDRSIEATYRKVIADEFPAMPGATELVRSLYEAGYKIAVGSSAPRENVEDSIRGLGIAPYLSATVCQNDVEKVKPDPAIFLLAATRIGIPPRNCIVVEDSIFGITAAKAAGMFCIGLQSKGHRPEEYEKTDRVISSLSELDPISIRNGFQEATGADLAEALYSQKPKKYNCAQAIAQAFARDDLVESLASCGGGRAPEGLCGALHAALLILPEDERENARKRFRQVAGDILCRSIRPAGQTPCTECVRIAATILDDLKKQ